MIISIANNKGGTGKTTTAVNLGAALAFNDFDCFVPRNGVLEVDLDPQGNLSINLGVEMDELSQTIYDVLLNPESIPLSQVIITDLSFDMDLAPANIDLSGATVELMIVQGRETILSKALSPVKNSYDFILIDCPPNLGLLTLNALTAADLVIVPVQTEYLAMRSIKELTEIIDKVKERTNQSYILLYSKSNRRSGESSVRATSRAPHQDKQIRIDAHCYRIAHKRIRGKSKRVRSLRRTEASPMPLKRLVG